MGTVLRELRVRNTQRGHLVIPQLYRYMYRNPCLYSYEDGPSGVPKMSASEKEVYLQDTLTLICDRSTINDGNPVNYKYLWYRNDTLLEETAYKQYKLVIQNIDDAGNYSCAIKNDLSSTDRSEPVTIRVHSIVGKSRWCEKTIMID